MADNPRGQPASAHHPASGKAARAVPKKKGRYVGLARSTGGASSSSSAHYPLVDELMEQIKTKDTEIEFLKQDNAEIRVELQQNRTTMEENNVLTQTLLQKFRTRFGEDF
ncbi:hypothetical protein DY000_02009742 [Brassica cretica]|uniref:Uncharacterized protein n=1 Tax=Brassica cretica TaxID=69181 RepID=A0ABQ7C8H5_BRACR|nr:hypothetical protein DY000_02009742 [Brassica cretica]